MQVQTEATLTFGHTQESWSLVGKWGATDQAAVLDMLGERTGCPSPFCDFLSFLSIMFQALHSFLLSLVYCFECPEGCVFAQGPKSSFLLEVGPCLWGWWWWWASRRCFSQELNTDRNGPFEGSHSKWGCSASTVQLALRQLCSHSYLALSFRYRLPLLTSLIAFAQSLDVSLMSQ